MLDSLEDSFGSCAEIVVGAHKITRILTCVDEQTVWR
jgi:hypothetical protein